MSQPTRNDMIYIYSFAKAARLMLEANELDGDVDYSDIVQDLLEKIEDKARVYEDMKQD